MKVNHDKKYLEDRRKELGGRLRGLREARGLSQLQLGEMVGLAVDTIDKIECGKWNFPINYLVNFADALGVRIELKA